MSIMSKEMSFPCPCCGEWVILHSNWLESGLGMKFELKKREVKNI